MCFFFSLIPATFFVLLGYFVLVSSRKVEGAIRKFGLILAIWLFIIAVFFPISGAYMTLSGQCPMTEMMQSMEMPIEQY